MVHVIQNFLNVFHCKVSVWIGLPKEVVNLVEIPTLLLHQEANDLMSQGIVRLIWYIHRLQILFASHATDRHGLQRIIRIHSDDEPLCDASNSVTTPTHTLNETCNLPRTHILNHHVNPSNVYAQLQRRCGNKPLQIAVLQSPFSRDSRRLSQGAVMDGNREVHVPNFESAGQNL